MFWHYTGRVSSSLLAKSISWPVLMFPRPDTSQSGEAFNAVIVNPAFLSFSIMDTTVADIDPLPTEDQELSRVGICVESGLLEKGRDRSARLKLGRIAPFDSKISCGVLERGYSHPFYPQLSLTARTPVQTPVQ